MDELATTMMMFAQPHPVAAGGLVAIHDSGGERQLLIDLAADTNAPLADIGPATTERLEELLDPGLPPVNPLDAWGAGGPGADKIMCDCLAALMSDPQAALGAVVQDRAPHGALYHHYFEYLTAGHAASGKPVFLVSNRQGSGTDPEAVEWTRAGFPVIDGLRPFLAGVRCLLAHRDFRDRPTVRPGSADPEAVSRWRARLARGDTLEEYDSSRMLRDFGFPMNPARLADNPASVRQAAGELGFPLVLKTAEKGILHKTDCGGVRLDIATPGELDEAYADLAGRLGPRVMAAPMVAMTGVEMVIGLVRDEQFGPLVMLGFGGINVEAIRDVAYALPPFDRATARRLVDSLQLRSLLDGLRRRRRLLRSRRALFADGRGAGRRHRRNRHQPGHRTPGGLRRRGRAGRGQPPGRDGGILSSAHAMQEPVKRHAGAGETMSLAKIETHDYPRWQSVATYAVSRLETRLFIDGEFRDAAEGGRFQTVNPATGETLTKVAKGRAEDIDRAVATALAAYRSGCWSRIAPRERMDILYRFADLIDERAEELAVLETLDMGKPIGDVVAEDLPAVIDTIRFMAEGIDKIEGSVTNTDNDALHLVIREPLGVVGCISPWNYPLLMATWKIAPALAAGNTVVLKPAEQSPLSALRLAELFVRAGGPPGVFNVVNGTGEIAGKALALHNDVAKISFTGSTEVGKLILQYAGRSNMKRVALECGGKSPQIFMADLPDLKRAVDAAYNGVFANMGEVCSAGSRLLVERPIYDEFIERFVGDGQDAYVPGDPLNPSTNMGPLVDRDAQQRVLRMIEGGKREGATLHFGGDAPAGLEKGAYVNPTLFGDVRNDMSIARQEIFGPVASVIPFDGPDEAIAIANDTIYGLAAGIWTKDLNKAMRLVKNIEAT
jgi:gamma-glutamyl-gamma-aminobutyraldehyde dehydrogenase